jgi:hypothetical protein
MSLWRANGLSRRASPTDSAHLREKQRAQTPLDLFRETQLSRYNAVSDDIGAGMRRRFSGSLARSEAHLVCDRRELLCDSSHLN